MKREFKTEIIFEFVVGWQDPMPFTLMPVA